MLSLYVLTCYRANELTPPAFGHPLKRGTGQIGLIIKNYESDEDLGFGFDGGCDAAGGMPTGEDGTDGGCAR